MADSAVTLDEPLYVCPSCGLLAPMAGMQDECTPGWTHGRLIRVERVAGSPPGADSQQPTVAATVADERVASLTAAILAGRPWGSLELPTGHGDTCGATLGEAAFALESAVETLLAEGDALATRLADAEDTLRLVAEQWYGTGHPIPDRPSAVRRREEHWARLARAYFDCHPEARESNRQSLSEPEARETCSVCGGRGWHTAGGNDPTPCGACPAGEAWHSGTEKP